jgi:hypothetical protein
VASSPGVATVTEGDSTGTSRVGVLDDSGSDGFPGSASVAKAGTGAWAAARLAPAGSPGGAGLGDHAGPARDAGPALGAGLTGGTSAPWEASARSDAGAGKTASDTDSGQRRPGEPGRRPGRDNGADWSDVLAERDSGAWPTVSGGRAIGAPLPTRENDAWRSESGSGWDTGSGSGSTDSWTSGPGGPRAPDRSTGGQPWGSLEAAPREAFEPADAGRHGTAPQLAATRAADGGAHEAKPAERHSHRAPGRHGRPARRIWDRAGKDKDRDE